MKDKDNKDRGQQQVPSAAAPVPPKAEETLRQGHGPVCEEHKVPCVAKSTTATYTYYYCPVDGCRVSHKVLRPHVKARIQKERNEKK